MVAQFKSLKCGYITLHSLVLQSLQLASGESQNFIQLPSRACQNKEISMSFNLILYFERTLAMVLGRFITEELEQFRQLIVSSHKVIVALLLYIADGMPLLAMKCLRIDSKASVISSVLF